MKSELKSGFGITGKKGFHMLFENGWGVSVQFGPGNYCSNYKRRIGVDDEACGREGSPDAECAVFNPGGDLVEPAGFGWGDTVNGQMKPADVLKLMNWAAAQS